MANKFNPDKYASGLYGRTEQYSDKVRKYYINAIDELLSLASSADIKPDEMFRFADNPKLSAKATSVFRTLYSNVYATIKGGIKSEWDYANLSCDELVTDIFGKDVIKDNHFARWFNRNQEAMDAFFARKKEGLNLSQRVWKYTGQLKNEMEMALTVSLGKGDSATTVSKEVRKCLNEPDRLFRRVKNADGNLQLSKAAKAYHPGQGVYRSSYKNAMRLTRSEPNIAYRTADSERWKQLNFVIGIRIALSKQHPDYDICDILAGDYPKDFVFQGWHPQCFCFATPILATPEEMISMQKQLIAGEEPTIRCANTVKSAPKHFKEWVSDNRERAKGWGNMPYFVKNNPKYVKGFEVNTYTQAERKFTRAFKTNDAMDKSLGTYLTAKYPDIPNTEVAAIYHYTKGEGAAYRQLNNQLRKEKPLSEFNQAFAGLLSQGLDKMPIYDGTAYRGLRLNKTQLRDWLATSGKGGEKTLNGFTSASKLRDVADKFTLRGNPKSNETAVILKIKSKNGRSISDISEFNGIFAEHNQQEILFDRGSQFKVVRSYVENGRIFFDLEQL